jgi:hypothetical protein
MPITPRFDLDDNTALSRPVAFQNPADVARFVRVPLGYLRSLKLKKYRSDDDRSSSPLPPPVPHLSGCRKKSEIVREKLT